jgi:3-oxoacyl-[acyl-carrier-protein] synthase I
MREVFIVSDNIVSPLGFTAGRNFSQLKKGVSGIQLQHDDALSYQPVYASLFGRTTDFEVAENKLHFYTKFEKLLIASIQDALSGNAVDSRSEKTALIISSTKGNISLMEQSDLNGKLKKRIALHTSAQLVADYFHFTTKPIVVSHACISGLVAIITGMRLLQWGKYDHAVVAGADVITKFILSGFQSFQAISAEPCKPFDAKRNGITLGEGAATVVLSVNKPALGNVIKISGGAISNDANHISGPSRTGEELFQSVKNAMSEAGTGIKDIGFISAHGTATVYNDEMEAKTINLAGMEGIPVNSLKGYYGHTLGAAGLIETVVSIHSLRENIVLPTRGFREAGTSKPLNVTRSLQKGPFNACLKTASGFGGCNAAVILQKAV